MLAERVKQAETDEDFQQIERELGSRWICETLYEVAEALGLHVQTLHGWRTEGMPGCEGFWSISEIFQWRVARAERRGGSSDDESERASEESQRQSRRLVMN